MGGRARRVGFGRGLGFGMPGGGWVDCVEGENGLIEKSQVGSDCQEDTISRVSDAVDLELAQSLLDLQLPLSP